ncbi:MAG: helix-turn-helix domain-containing protein [Chloroflexota bacterium]
MSPEADAGHETIGTIFNRARRARQLSLRQVADQIGVTFAYIADLEKDRRLPSDATALKLAELLGLDPDALLARMGRLRQTVMDYLRQHPENGRVLAASCSTASPASTSSACCARSTGLPARPPTRGTRPKASTRQRASLAASSGPNPPGAPHRSLPVSGRWGHH